MTVDRNDGGEWASEAGILDMNLQEAGEPGGGAVDFPASYFRCTLIILQLGGLTKFSSTAAGAWWPGKIPAATETAAISGMFDILPAFAALAGARLSADRKLDGANIWPHLAGTPDAKPAHETCFYYNGLRLNAGRHGDWKLQIAMGNKADPAAKNFEPQLYNLRTDIGEAANVAAANPEVVAKLQALIASRNDDLGTDGIGPGCREPGRVENAQPLIPHDAR